MSETDPFPRDPTVLIPFMREHQRDYLPGLLGIELLEMEPGLCLMRLQLEQKHLASNGYLHAGTVVTVADSAAGYGTLASRPSGSTGFTTIELKCNHIGSVREGAILARATMVHGGRTTQVWDAVVTVEDSRKTLALFRNTQLLLYP
ncbi:MAG TPA: PaaI family thioesterase [Acidimicrobiia bacterium]|jgi:uncharacterized protein (TIGR00369 family)